MLQRPSLPHRLERDVFAGNSPRPHPKKVAVLSPPTRYDEIKPKLAIITLSAMYNGYINQIEGVSDYVLFIFFFRFTLSSLRILIQSRHAILFWLLMTICMFTITAYGLTLLNPSFHLGLFMTSFTLMDLSVFDRMIYKRVTQFVVLNRVQKTLHIAMSIRADDPADLRNHLIRSLEISLRVYPTSRKEKTTLSKRIRKF